MRPHLDLAKQYWKEHVRPGSIALDATCGNGKDTLFLARLPLSCLFAMDIQEEAVQNTSLLLQKHLTSGERTKVQLLQMSHEDLTTLPTPLHLAVYNLGYLPGGDKNKTTLAETTVASLSSLLPKMAERSAISITCYPGHAEGKREKEALLHFIGTLAKDEWSICHFECDRENAPSLLWITRI